MKSRQVIALLWWLTIVGVAHGQSAPTDSTETVRLDFTDTAVQVQVWPPKLHAYGLVWLPNGTAADRTGLGFGLDTAMPYKLKGDQESLTSQLAFSFTGTTKNQWRFKLSTDLHWNENRNYADFRVGYDDLAREFFGIGPGADEHDVEDYLPHDFLTYIETTWRLAGQTLAIGPRVEYEHVDIKPVEDDGMLNSGEVPGATGSAVMGIGLALTWDYRDNRYQPSSGWYIRSSFLRFFGTGGGGYAFSQLGLDARIYRRIATEQVLAGQIVARGVTDSTPFWRLSSLGGRSYSRAYSYYRWIDDVLLAAQGEWRWRALRRWGLAGFAGAAVVDDSLRTLQFRYLRPSLGVGVRFFSERGDDAVPVRVDFAVGYESWRISAGISEAF